MSSVPIPLQEILLATDFREPARRALSFARRIARHRSALLRAVHILDLTGFGEGNRPSFAAAHDSAERALREIRHELRLAGIQNAATLLSAGEPAAALRGLVRQHQPSLLVLGINGTLSQNPASLGATARVLLDDPVCPTLTVSDRCPVAASDALNRLLIVVDNDPASLRAALQAWPPEPSQFPPAMVAILPRHAKPEWQLGASLGRQFHPILLVEEARAADAVLRRAAETQAGLIVVAFASGSPLASPIQGALAHTLLTQAACPVLTVRS